MSQHTKMQNPEQTTADPSLLSMFLCFIQHHAQFAFLALLAVHCAGIHRYEVLTNTELNLNERTAVGNDAR